MTRYKVQGMTCGGCEASVTRALKQAAPSAQVQADSKADTVSVEGMDASEVQRIVDEAGFKFVGPA